MSQRERRPYSKLVWSKKAGCSLVLVGGLHDTEAQVTQVLIILSLELVTHHDVGYPSISGGLPKQKQRERPSYEVHMNDTFICQTFSI